MKKRPGNFQASVLSEGGKKFVSPPLINHDDDNIIYRKVRFQNQKQQQEEVFVENADNDAHNQEVETEQIPSYINDPYFHEIGLPSQMLEKLVTIGASKLLNQSFTSKETKTRAKRNNVRMGPNQEYNDENYIPSDKSCKLWGHESRKQFFQNPSIYYLGEGSQKKRKQELYHHLITFCSNDILPHDDDVDGENVECGIIVCFDVEELYHSIEYQEKNEGRESQFTNMAFEELERIILNDPNLSQKIQAKQIFNDDIVDLVKLHYELLKNDGFASMCNGTSLDNNNNNTSKRGRGTGARGRARARGKIQSQAPIKGPSGVGASNVTKAMSPEEKKSLIENIIVPMMSEAIVENNSKSEQEVEDEDNYEDSASSKSAFKSYITAMHETPEKGVFGLHNIENMNAANKSYREKEELQKKIDSECTSYWCKAKKLSSKYYQKLIGYSSSMFQTINKYTYGVFPAIGRGVKYVAKTIFNKLPLMWLANILLELLFALMCVLQMVGNIAGFATAAGISLYKQAMEKLKVTMVAYFGAKSAWLGNAAGMFVEVSSCVILSMFTGGITSAICFGKFVMQGYDTSQSWYSNAFSMAGGLVAIIKDLFRSLSTFFVGATTDMTLTAGNAVLGENLNATALGAKAYATVNVVANIANKAKNMILKSTGYSDNNNDGGGSSDGKEKFTIIGLIGSFFTSYTDIVEKHEYGNQVIGNKITFQNASYANQERVGGNMLNLLIKDSIFGPNGMNYGFIFLIIFKTIGPYIISWYLSTFSAYSAALSFATAQITKNKITSKIANNIVEIKNMILGMTFMKLTNYEMTDPSRQYPSIGEMIQYMLNSNKVQRAKENMSAGYEYAKLLASQAQEFAEPHAKKAKSAIIDASKIAGTTIVDTTKYLYEENKQQIESFKKNAITEGKRTMGEISLASNKIKSDVMNELNKSKDKLIELTKFVKAKFDLQLDTIFLYEQKKPFFEEIPNYGYLGAPFRFDVPSMGLPKTVDTINSMEIYKSRVMQEYNQVRENTNLRLVAAKAQHTNGEFTQANYKQIVDTIIKEHKDAELNIKNSIPQIAIHGNMTIQDINELYNNTISAWKKLVSSKRTALLKRYESTKNDYENIYLNDEELQSKLSLPRNYLEILKLELESEIQRMNRLELAGVSVVDMEKSYFLTEPKKPGTLANQLSKAMWKGAMSSTGLTGISNIGFLELGKVMQVATCIFGTISDYFFASKSSVYYNEGGSQGQLVIVSQIIDCVLRLFSQKIRICFLIARHLGCYMLNVIRVNMGYFPLNCCAGTKLDIHAKKLTQAITEDEKNIQKIKNIADERNQNGKSFGRSAGETIGLLNVQKPFEVTEINGQTDPNLLGMTQYNLNNYSSQGMLAKGANIYSNEKMFDGVVNSGLAYVGMGGSTNSVIDFGKSMAVKGALYGLSDDQELTEDEMNRYGVFNQNSVFDNRLQTVYGMGKTSRR